MPWALNLGRFEVRRLGGIGAQKERAMETMTALEETNWRSD